VYLLGKMGVEGEDRGWILGLRRGGVGGKVEGQVGDRLGTGWGQVGVVGIEEERH